MATLDARRNPDTGKVTSYRVRWREAGSGPWQSESFGKDRAAARAFKGQVEANGDRRPADVPKRKHGPTVQDLVSAYIDDRAKRVRSDRTTADSHRDARNWIYPQFGTMPVDSVREADIQAWVDAFPRSPKTVANVHGLLSAAYAWGLLERNGHVLRGNPCAGTELPPRRPRIPRGLRSGEWAVLYRAACDLDPDAADFLLFLVGTGWRWSEASALQVHQVDLGLGVVDMTGVRRRTAAGKVVHVDDAKSAASHGRRTRLSPRVVDMLRRRTTGRALGDLVFTSQTGRPLHYGNFRERSWKPILARAKKQGLRVTPTPHWLRHTQAAMLIESGASLPAVQRRLGHESITTTVDTYGRLVDDVPPEVLDSLDRALFLRSVHPVSAEPS